MKYILLALLFTTALLGQNKQEEETTTLFCYKVTNNSFEEIFNNNRYVSIENIDETNRQGIIFTIKNMAIEQGFFFETSRDEEKAGLLTDEQKKQQLCLVRTIEKKEDLVMKCPAVNNWQFLWRKDADSEFITPATFSYKKCI